MRAKRISGPPEQLEPEITQETQFDRKITRALVEAPSGDAKPPLCPQDAWIAPFDKYVWRPKEACLGHRKALRRLGYYHVRISCLVRILALNESTLSLVEVGANAISHRSPYEQFFSVLDASISFPKDVDEKVTKSMVYIYTFVLPLAVLLGINLAYGPGTVKQRFVLLNYSVLGLGTSVVFAQLLTEYIKLVVGRPRPDFLSRCEPDAARVQEALNSTIVKLFDSTVCKTTNSRDLKDGFRSFPSSHSSMSFAGLAYLSLYMAGRFRIFTPHSIHGKHLYAYTIAIVPLFLASFIASSRVSDFREHGLDALAGAILGIVFAIIGYRYYFPWLGSRDAGTPWAILREEGLVLLNTGVHSKTGSHIGAPLLPTAAPHAQRSVDETASNLQPVELHPLPQLNVSTPPPAHSADTK
ncbi:hypothetical protein FRC17_001403 [Serendipita sp. 399]|nr:hypothetical protein FRC17_001403 [Serendipita sp. 399]